MKEKYMYIHYEEYVEMKEKLKSLEAAIFNISISETLDEVNKIVDKVNREFGLWL